MMGVWFVASAFANYLAAPIASLASIPKGVSSVKEMAIYNTAFIEYGIIGVVAGLLIVFMTPTLKKMMQE